MRALFGIDIGTRGTKAILYSQDGHCLAEAFFASQPSHPAAGCVEEDPELQLTSVLSTVRACMVQSNIRDLEVVAIGIAGQMAGVIGIGSDGRAVTPYDSWLDTRCASYITKMQEVAGEEILAKTGSVPSFNHGPKLLWWKHERPRDYECICAFVQPAAYVAMRLCGLGSSHAFIDPTYLHFSGLANSRLARWDDDLCRRFGIEVEKLPRIVEPTTLIGIVTADMASSAGLKPGVRVVAGCGDTAASFLACGAVREGICVDVAGTASVFASTISEFVPDTKSHTLSCGRSVAPGLWHSYAYVNGGGQNLEWFKGEVRAKGETFDDLCTLASDETSDDHLPFFVPHLGGRVSPSWPNLRGSWVGLSWDTSAGSLFRSMLEGVALEYALYRAALQDLLPAFNFQELRVTGGGEKSPVWNQLKADRLQCDVVGIARGGGAAAGAAIVAGVGAGILRNIQEASNQWVALGSRFQARSNRAALSARRVKRYEQLLRALNKWSDPTPVAP